MVAARPAVVVTRCTYCVPCHPSHAPAQFNTACPGLFGTPVEFRKNFEHPILAGRDANATDKQLEKVGRCCNV